MPEIIINTEKEQLDLNFIHHFISNAYWAKNRTLEDMKTCIDHSLNFGVYCHDKQIGYARIVTDYAQFAYLMDLFIDEAYRSHGYSKKLMQYIMNMDSLRNIKVWRLATDDAHLLYEKFGFKPLAKPESLMEKIRA